MAEMLNGQNGKHKAVNRLLRRRSSKYYFDGNGWTTNREQAKTFADAIEAAEICSRHGLSDVEIVLQMERCDVFCTPLR
jgi:hypothetical protein